jgi:glycosyltransferase involved in cell wall biosynthesis
MRIIYLLTSLGMGGAERQVLELASRMAQRGHVVGVLVLMPRVDEEWPTALHVMYLNMHRSPWSVIAGVAKGRRFVLNFQPDLLHSHSFHANFVARMLKVLAPSTTVLSTVHNIYEGGWARMWAYRLTDRLAWGTAAVSTAAAKRFVRLKAIPQDKCLVMPNGIDTAEFVPSADRRREKRILMAAGAEFIWLAVGRVVPAKDYSTLLRAFAQVYAARRDARLWIAGAEASAVEAATVRALTMELGLEDGVSWLGLCRDLPALLDACDAFVLASAWEGMPLAVGEAMAMKKAVVVTDAGGVRELVGDAGWIVPARAPDALGAAMLQLMRKAKEERLALGSAARGRIGKLFSMDARASEWEALYQRILKTP